MLAELHVRDLALVEEVWLELGPGLTVLSGETGAGKTVLVSALKLLLGERADSAMVRQGAAEALVEGRFVLDGREVLARRRLTAEGRSRCAIDGEMASVSMLADVLGPHVDLHGQHEHQALLSVVHHRGYLDRFIGPEADEALNRYRAAFAAARAAQEQLASVEHALAERERRADYLHFQVADVDAVAPQEGEDAELEARLPRLRFAERLAAASGAAWTALREEGGAADHLAEAAGALVQARGLDPALDAIGDALAALEIEIQESAAVLRDYAAGIEHDPAALDQTEHRMRQLTDLARKYGGTLAGAIRARDEALRELEVLEEGETAAERARAAAEAAQVDLRSAAEHLGAVRAGAVDAFTERLGRAAADLALPNATFAVSLTTLPEDAWTPDGGQRVEFLFASAQGEQPRPLAKIASGGEISRVMLALKSVLGAADDVPVLVFDEVDAGIGGATALAVGRRLASLATDHQVLVVTHLPQVAAYADTQVVVARAESAGRSVTTAHRLETDERVGEIARMLAGGSTEAGLAHAGELLEQAGREREALTPTVGSAG